MGAAPKGLANGGKTGEGIIPWSGKRAKINQYKNEKNSRRGENVRRESFV